jgi:hypothetical protein
MNKLRNLVLKLREEDLSRIEDSLVRTKADNYLFLLRAYRGASADDEDIREQLKITSNSLYVLKSRLTDKIQEHLSGDIYSGSGEVVRQLHRVPEMCFETPREVAFTMLKKLEEDLLKYDMHNELLAVYSGLKKINLHSEKYFYYSQLYNRHAAFSLSLEKCEEILGSFNRALSHYELTRAQRQLDTLQFLARDISDHFTLNPSRQTELIRNFINLQLGIFCDTGLNRDDIEDLLQASSLIIDALPEGSAHKNWRQPLNYLYFEFYRKAGQQRSATGYYESLMTRAANILLYSPVCVTSRFPLSRICFLQQSGRTAELGDSLPGTMLHDPSDMLSDVARGIAAAMSAYYRNNLKEAALALNSLLNVHSFKDAFHVSSEIRLTLAFVYMVAGEPDLASGLVKSISRKLKDESPKYDHLAYLLRAMQARINEGSPSKKQGENYSLFKAANTGEGALLEFLIHELDKKFN